MTEKKKKMKEEAQKVKRNVLSLFKEEERTAERSDAWRRTVLSSLVAMFLSLLRCNLSVCAQTSAFLSSVFWLLNAAVFFEALSVSFVFKLINFHPQASLQSLRSVDGIQL